jgi:hypothetical protein
MHQDQSIYEQPEALMDQPSYIFGSELIRSS